MYMKIVTKQEVKDMIKSSEIKKVEYDKDWNHNPIMRYDFNNLLIKVDNHYIPAEYLFYDDTGEENTDMFDDKEAEFPKVEFDSKYGKYKFTFDSADFGGYDAARFTYYFDSIEDIMKELGITKENKNGNV